MNTTDPRDRCPLSSDAIRRARVEETGGSPHKDFPTGETPFVEYTRTGNPQLQHRTPPHDRARLRHPEPGEGADVQSPRHRVRSGSRLAPQGIADDAMWTLRRATWRSRRCSRAGTGSPRSRSSSRSFDQLGDASGFQSVSYRRLEFVLGNKNPAMVAPHRNSPSFEDVHAQLLAPSLYDEVLGYLRRRGLAIPSEVVGGAVYSQTHEPQSHRGRRAGHTGLSGSGWRIATSISWPRAWMERRGPVRALALHASPGRPADPGR